MKKPVLLAAMLVMALAAPALAQSRPASGIQGFITNISGDEPGDEDDLLCLIPEGCGLGDDIPQAPGEDSPVSSTPGLLTEGL